MAIDEIREALIGKRMYEEKTRDLGIIVGIGNENGRGFCHLFLRGEGYEFYIHKRHLEELCQTGATICRFPGETLYEVR